jgi:hypothetical protein
MAHGSPGDPSPHYTVVGVDVNNKSIKDTHLKLDASKQFVSPNKYENHSKINQKDLVVCELGWVASSLTRWDITTMLPMIDDLRKAPA